MFVLLWYFFDLCFSCPYKNSLGRNFFVLLLEDNIVPLKVFFNCFYEILHAWGSLCGAIIITKETNLHFEICSVVCSIFPWDWMIIVTNLCVRFSQLLITSDWPGLTTTRRTWKTVHFVLWLMFSWVSKSLHLNNHATLTHSGDFCYFSDLGERSRFISRDSDHPISALREVTSPCDTSRSSRQSFQIYLDASET